MRLTTLGVQDFRNFSECEVQLAPEGITVIAGPNGQGKTSLLEAVSMLGSLESFRTSDTYSMIAFGRAQARIVAKLTDADPSSSRILDLAVRLVRDGRTELFRNGNKLRKSNDFLGEISTIVFFPDDLDIIKGSPGARRRMLDEGIVAQSPSNSTIRRDFERALRQRTAFLKQIRGKLGADEEITLDIWDDRLATSGEELVAAREALVSMLREPVNDVYQRLSGSSAGVEVHYERSFQGKLAESLLANRQDDIRSQSTTRGPQRDDLSVLLGGSPARSFGSQGEQRCLALALKMGIHRIISEKSKLAGGEGPILILDDVFSELDPARSDALARSLPSGQVLVSAASGVPDSLVPSHRIQVMAGTASESEL